MCDCCYAKECNCNVGVRIPFMTDDEMTMSPFEKYEKYENKCFICYNICTSCQIFHNVDYACQTGEILDKTILDSNSPSDDWEEMYNEAAEENEELGLW